MRDHERRNAARVQNVKVTVDVRVSAGARKERKRKKERKERKKERKERKKEKKERKS